MSISLTDYIVKPHALMEMGRRQITDQQVGEILANPEQVIEVSSQRRVFQGSFWVGRREYLLRIVVDVDREPAEVVTVYRTGKIAKYWR